MYCPQCRYEFKVGISVCPDCGVPLLMELPSPAPAYALSPGRLDVKHILSTIDPAILALAKSRLDEADIPYVVKNERIQQVMLLAVGIKERTIEIWVRQDHAEEAKELLQDFLEDA